MIGMCIRKMLVLSFKSLAHPKQSRVAQGLTVALRRLKNTKGCFLKQEVKREKEPRARQAPAGMITCWLVIAPVTQPSPSGQKVHHLKISAISRKWPTLLKIAITLSCSMF